MLKTCNADLYKGRIKLNMSAHDFLRDMILINIKINIKGIPW